MAHPTLLDGALSPAGFEVLGTGTTPLAGQVLGQAGEHFGPQLEDLDVRAVWNRGLGFSEFRNARRTVFGTKNGSMRSMLVS